MTAAAVFSADLRGLEWCRVIVANLDGPDIDSGTAWECGYGYANGKYVVGFRTDLRGAGEGELAPFNIMLAASVDALLPTWPTSTPTEIAALICDAVRGVAP